MNIVTRFRFARAANAEKSLPLSRERIVPVSLEDQKESVRAFVAGVSVVPGEARLDVQMRTLPAVGSVLPTNSACGLVAGARYTPLQIEMMPVERFLAGLWKVA